MRIYLQVVTAAKSEDLDVFVAVLGPTYVTPSVKMDKLSLHKYVDQVAQTYDSSSLACTMFRHATGPLTRKVFYNSVMLNGMNGVASSTIQNMVKAEEQRRIDELKVSFQVCAIILWTFDAIMAWRISTCMSASGVNQISQV